MSITFTTTVTEVTMSSAKLSCTVSGAGAINGAVCGFQIHVDNGYGGSRLTRFLAEHGEHVKCELKNDSFSYECTGCKQGVLISARPYLKGEKETFYGDPFLVTIKTEQDYAPNVSDLKIDSVTIDSADLSAVVLVSDSSYPVLETGFKYRPRHGDVSKTIKCTPDAKGKITAKLEGLGSGVDYVVWAYASCSISGSFKFDSFTTHDYEVLPTISEPIASDITRTGMSLSAVVTTPNALYKATEAGFYYCQSGSIDVKKMTCTPLATGEMTAKITGLDPGTKYILRSYVVSESVERTSVAEVSTLGREALPSVSVPDFGSVTESSFSVTASVEINHASYTPSEVGFVFKRDIEGGSTTLDNGMATREICTLSNGKFTLTKKDIGPGKYKIRAYLLSDGEDIYSKDLLQYSTDMSECVPAVKLTEAGKGDVTITENKKRQMKISVSALLEMTYGAEVKEKGFLYRMSKAPTGLTDSSSKLAVSTGYSSSVQLPIPDTGYSDWYFVAYATNKNGTGYSAPMRIRIWWKDYM